MIMEVTPYEHGKINGVKYRYFETGLLEEEAEYSKDVLNGFIIKYNSDGTVRLKQEYKKGFPIEKVAEIRSEIDQEIDEEKPDLLSEEEMDRLL